MSIDQVPILAQIPILQRHFVAKVDRASFGNLQRWGGFKGFNQHAFSLIITETDPQKQRAQ
jgi:hypothetical protein